jgi:hypothetical protein
MLIDAELGGAMLTPESLKPGADKKMVGSVLIYEAENIEQVKELVYGQSANHPLTITVLTRIVPADVYYTAKVAS